MLLHQDAVTIAPVVVTEVADGQVTLESVKCLRAEILVFHHKRDKWSAENIFNCVQQGRADTPAPEAGVDTEVENTSLRPISVADNASDDALPGASDQDLRSWPEIEDEQCRQAIGLTTGETSPLECA
jgi:hypothetical protein